MPDRCGNVRRDRLTFELFQAEDGFEEFASSILAAKWRNSHLYFTFSYSHCVHGSCVSRPMERYGAEAVHTVYFLVDHLLVAHSLGRSRDR